MFERKAIDLRCSDDLSDAVPEYLAAFGFQHLGEKIFYIFVALINILYILLLYMFLPETGGETRTNRYVVHNQASLRLG